MISTSSRASAGRRAVPVILLTGYLGAGKTSLLNHLLRHPDSRIGVVVNDFGDLNIDAGLVVGQVNEPFSISGGCICCLDDDGSLEEALVALADPALRLDAILVEASGFAEPLTLARMVSRMGRHRFHLGGVIDVVDALMHSSTVDVDVLPPVRYAATTLVLVNKLDEIPVSDRDSVVEAIRRRVHQRNPRVLVVGTSFGRVDPNLIFDPGAGEREAATGEEDEQRQAELPLRELLREAYAEREEKLESELAGADIGVGHRHAQSVTVTGSGCADAHAVMDFVEDLPAGVYRIKGTVAVWDRGRRRTFGVQAVGPNVYVSTNAPDLRAHVTGDAERPDDSKPFGDSERPGDSEPFGDAERPGDSEPFGDSERPGEWDSVLVVIGQSFDSDDVRSRLERALNPDRHAHAVPGTGRDGGANRGGRSAIERLLHHVRLHA